MVDPEKTDIAATLIRESKICSCFHRSWNFGRKRYFALSWRKRALEQNGSDFSGNRVFQENAIAVVAKNKGVFYDALNGVKPNSAHKILAKMEKRSFIEAVITQNIDHLHQQAGCLNVVELHGTYKQLICTGCRTEFDMSIADLNFLPPTCFICKRVLKPNITFLMNLFLTKQKNRHLKKPGNAIFCSSSEQMPKFCRQPISLWLPKIRS